MVSCLDPQLEGYLGALVRPASHTLLQQKVEAINRSCRRASPAPSSANQAGRAANRTDSTRRGGERPRWRPFCNCADDGLSD